MKPPRIILSILVLISTILYIRAEYLNLSLGIYLFKPLTTLSIIAVALMSLRKNSAFYPKAILLGLVFSLAGDLFLIFPSDYLMAGLVSFLFTHFCYMAAFKRGTPLRLAPIFTPLLVAFSSCVFLWLRPSLRDMQGPVLVYVISLSTMVWLAYQRWAAQRSSNGLSAWMGAMLFMASDLGLAIRLFRGDYAGSAFFIFGTYFSGQYLIALSTSQGDEIKARKI